MRERLLSLIKEIITGDERTVFAYAYGSFARKEDDFIAFIEAIETYLQNRH
jgi:hypothetical protein